MNLIQEVAKLLGVEIGQEFNIILADGNKSEYNPFHFEEDGLHACESRVTKGGHLLALIEGAYTIEIPPFKPKNKELYWYWSISGNTALNYLFEEGCTSDLIFWKIGNCFRTQEEAEAKGKALMESILKEYNNE